MGDYPPIENVPPLLMPVGVVGSAIGWRWEGPGGAITLVSQLAALPILLIHWPVQERFPRYLAASIWPLAGRRHPRRVVPGVLVAMETGAALRSATGA